MKSKHETYAALTAILTMVYLLTAAFNFWAHQILLGMICLLGGWGICVIGCFYYGAHYGIDLAYEPAEECMEQAARLVEELNEVCIKNRVEEVRSNIRLEAGARDGEQM